MSEHTIKVEPPYFDALLDGSKTFEVRRNDRAYQKGDTLRLIEVTERDCGNPDCTRGCRPRSIHKTVTFVYSGDPRFGGHGGLQPGYVVLGLEGIGISLPIGADHG